MNTINNNLPLASRFVSLGALVAMLAILLGAFGAHGLKNLFSEQQMAWYNTAFEYQIIHALALIITGLLASISNNNTFIKAAGIAFFTGIVIFSGSLYALAFTQLRLLGAVTPIGGTAFIIGWVLLALAGRNLTKGSKHAK